MSSRLVIEEVAIEAERFIKNRSEEDLWKLAEGEWRAAEAKIAPKRGSEDVKKTLEGIIGKLRERIRTNQGILPTTMAGLAGYVLGQLEVQYPFISEFKLLATAIVSLTAYSFQDQFLAQSDNKKK